MPTGGGPTSLFSSQCFYGIRGSGPQGQQANDGKCDQQDDRFGHKKSPDADRDTIGEIFQPAIDQPPAKGQGNEGGDGCEPDEMTRYQGQDIGLAGAQDFADPDLLCASFYCK